MKNECKMGGHGPSFMPATPIFQKHCFLKNCPKMVTKVENFKLFLCILGKDFIGHFQWYTVCFDTSSSLEIDGNVRVVKLHSNRTVLLPVCKGFLALKKVKI